MANEIILIGIFTVISLALGFAWVGGYLDKYQSKAQEIALDKMGENKASYGLKSRFEPTTILAAGLTVLPSCRYAQGPKDW